MVTIPKNDTNASITTPALGQSVVKNQVNDTIITMRILQHFLDKVNVVILFPYSFTEFINMLYSENE